ncbi:PD-(D/E)XK nuclease family protein [Prescottella equi]|uniref:PD-(D/E)XK nuclease family protein n=1 Tax=Rhodococcus hoagii TaxID=43767 RepID=UPI003D9814FA
MATAAHSHRYYLPWEAYAAASRNLDDLGQTIVFLPCEPDPVKAAFLAELTKREVTVDSDAGSPDGTLVVHASDADDEIRSVARLVRGHLAAGTPGHRIGVFYGAEDPYLHLLHEHLERAHIAFNGPEQHAFKDRPSARSLLRLLQIDTATMPRRDLLAILAERAVHWQDDDGNTLSVRQAEPLTRNDVPIVGGRDWDKISALEPGHHRYSTAMALARFVDVLRAALRAIEAAATWPDVSAAIVHLVERHYRVDPRNPGDFTNLRSIVESPVELDGVAPPPTPRDVVDAVAVRVDALRGTVGTVGASVTIGPIAAGCGRHLDVCVVVGMAEGIVPAVRREDPLLPDVLAGVTQAERLAVQHRQLTLTIGAGTVHRVLTLPRGSLRGGAEKVPSRWLLPTLAAFTGSTVSATGWQTETKHCAQVVTVESFDAATQTPDPRIGVGAASSTEWRLRALSAVPATERSTVLDDEIVQLGMAMRGDRWAGRFTRFNGNVETVAELIRLFDEPVAPTRLEDWVASPYIFFMWHVLGVQALDDPDEDVQIDPLTRGNLMHRVLERYVRELIEGAAGTLARLQDIADEEIGGAVDDAPGWLPQLWERDAASLKEDLEAWFDRDRQDRAIGWTPIGAERRFGDDGDAVSFDVGSMRLRFEGQVDRIDRHEDGRIRVTDYKTGRSDRYQGQSGDDPTAGCTRFQLPVYGLSAEVYDSPLPVDARYWFVTGKADFVEVGYSVDANVLDAFRSNMEFVYRSITSGKFPPKPLSAFDDLTRLIRLMGLERSWLELQDVAELAELVAIHENEAP